MPSAGVGMATGLDDVSLHRAQLSLEDTLLPVRSTTMKMDLEDTHTTYTHTHTHTHT